jgi:hypothetical protein
MAVAAEKPNPLMRESASNLIAALLTEPSPSLLAAIVWNESP